MINATSKTTLFYGTITATGGVELEECGWRSIHALEQHLVEEYSDDYDCGYPNDSEWDFILEINPANDVLKKHNYADFIEGVRELIDDAREYADEMRQLRSGMRSEML